MNREQIRIDFNKFQKRRELLWAPRIYKVLQNQVKYFLETYGVRPPNTDLIMLDGSQLYNLLVELYIDAGVTWGAKVYSTLPKLPKPQVKARMPIGLSEFLRQAIKDYLFQDLLSDVQNMTDTTKIDILVVLEKAANEGLSLDETVKLITDTAVTPARARLIARTETVTAANLGAQLAAAKTGLVMQKTWIAATDNRTRPDHREVNGTTIDFLEPFNVGGEPMQQPGDRGASGHRTSAKNICNCRCCAGYEAKRDSNDRLIRQQ